MFSGFRMTTSTSYDAPRTPRAINTPRAETAGKLDRRDALGAMFHAVDTNGDGRVDFTEAVAAACGVCAGGALEAMAWAKHLWRRAMIAAAGENGQILDST